MTISTIEICIIVALTVGIAIASWWLAIVYKYNGVVTSFTYSRGANLDTGSVGKGNTGIGSVELTCDTSREICVWKADTICSGGSTFNGEIGVEPISGNTATYGQFDPNTTVDITQKLALVANGQQSYTYKFDATQIKFGGKICPYGDYNQAANVGARPHLIATYSCVPKGSECKTFKPSTSEALKSVALQKGKASSLNLFEKMEGKNLLANTIISYGPTATLDFLSDKCNEMKECIAFTSTGDLKALPWGNGYSDFNGDLYYYKRVVPK